ncbi:MAG: hypothetical protein JHC93_00085 [Parachlamydiales bacterium]|nr:hypothetical protein [Parachlamydiales bacterium]
MFNKSKDENVKEEDQTEPCPASVTDVKKTITRLTVKCDCGFGNALYIRGQGSCLSWDKGMLLKNINSDEWVWETTEPFHTVEFKILINDMTYETGENHSLAPGATLSYTPTF